ncbi:DUF368 domain-containing protein [Bengtsoniella intestinalis]|uniref:DUF368 domain-containing protein n=1 Tax=Bengtsoniella intestinalis TaxID=3073143 RepID=UPI00391F0498
MKKTTPEKGQPLRNFLCGFLIGGGSILPGVSGGVLAVVFGIYRPLMDMLAKPKEAIPKNYKMLVPVVVGMVLGFTVFAMVISVALHGNTTVTTWCFIGLIAGTLPSMERESRRNGRTVGCYLSFALCATVVLVSLLMVGVADTSQANPDLLWYAVCGVILGLGSAVPGLSSSTLLMAMGMYTPMMSAVAELNWVALASFVPWTVVTLLALARLVTWVFDRFHGIAYHGIMGIVIAATVVIVPTSYNSVWEVVLSALLAVGGFVLALTMVKMEQQLPS